LAGLPESEPEVGQVEVEAVRVDGLGEPIDGRCRLTVLEDQAG
jgi:hypothetical protein